MEQNSYKIKLNGMNAIMKTYTRHYRKDKWQDTVRTDEDIIKENFKFVWDEEIDDPIEGESMEVWEKRIAKKYYDKLYKEFCLADLSKYKEGKTALRWRSEDEVINGKGQLICGNIKCNKSVQKTWEVNFGYFEEGIKKNALVNISLCEKCGVKLNYK